MTGIRNDIAALVRRVDGANSMDPAELGYEVAARIVQPQFRNLYGGDIASFVARVNPEKTMGAGALADAIVDHFHLEEN